ncbi:hypothetical protein KUTeg_007369 [Tegillarca granosa]|uniref:Uncharacterized protein n=1 Tax=Tegillarca granosa TaxID=220873 RepID=A0ABQ9FD30_TEGGR|nr:hypothetical protein KUTeg_007369 [Tegillarca granosa]
MGNKMIQMNFVEEGIDNNSEDVCRIDICHSKTDSLLILLHVSDDVKVKILPFSYRTGTGWKIINLSESESLCIPVFESSVESETESGAKQTLRKIVAGRSRGMNSRNWNTLKGLESNEKGKRKLDDNSNSHVGNCKKPKYNSTASESNRIAHSGLRMSNVVSDQTKFTTGDLQVNVLCRGFVILPKPSESKKQLETENSENTAVTEDDYMDSESSDLPNVTETMTLDAEHNEHFDTITIKEEPDSEDEMNKDGPGSASKGEMNKDGPGSASISQSIVNIKQEKEEESLPLLLTCTSENFISSPDLNTEDSASCFSSTPAEKFPVKSDGSSPSDFSSVDGGSASANHNSSLENHSSIASLESCNFMSESPMSIPNTHYQISESQTCHPKFHQSVSESQNGTQDVSEDHNSTLDSSQSNSKGHSSMLDSNQFNSKVHNSTLDLDQSNSVLCPSSIQHLYVDSEKNISDSVKESLKKMITSENKGKVPTSSNPSMLTGDLPKASSTTASKSPESNMPTLRKLLSTRNSVVSIGTFVPVDKPDIQTEKDVQVYEYTLLSVENPSALIKHSDKSEKICSVPTKPVIRSDDVLLLKDALSCTDSESQKSVNYTNFKNYTQTATCISPFIAYDQNQQNRSSDTNTVDTTSISQVCNITTNKNTTFNNHGNNMIPLEDTSISGVGNQLQTNSNLPNFVSEYIDQPKIEMSQNIPVNITMVFIPVRHDTGISTISTCEKASVGTIPAAMCTSSEMNSDFDHSVVKIEKNYTNSECSNGQSSKEIDQAAVHSQLYSVSSSECLLKNSPFDSVDSSDYDYTSSEEDEKIETRGNGNSLDSERKKNASVVMVAVEHDVFKTDKGEVKTVENSEDYKLKTSNIKVENGEIKLDISNRETSSRPDAQLVKVLNSTNKVLNVLIDGSLRSIAPLSVQSYLNYSACQKLNLNQNENILPMIKTENDDSNLYEVVSNTMEPDGGILDTVRQVCHSESDLSGQGSSKDHLEEIVKMSKSKDIKHFQDLNMKLQRQIPYDFLKVKIPREIYLDPCLNRPSFVVLERLQRLGNLLTIKSDCNRLCRSQTIRKYKEIPIDIHLS